MPYSPSDTYLSRVELELPRGVEGIADLLTRVESEGPIQRILLEMGHPVLLWQWISEPDHKETGVDQVIRNSRLVEYTADTRVPSEIVLGMLHEVSKQRRYPCFWACGPNTELHQWIVFDGQLRLSELAGLQLLELEELPAERLVLGGSTRRFADPQDVDFCLSYVMEVA